MSAADFLATTDASALQNVWRGDDLATQETVIATGFESLDAQLPGGGWPVGHLVEVLQSHTHEHVWQLLLPALEVCAKNGPVVLVAPPAVPFLPGIAAQGVAADRLLLIKTDKPASSLWACEQALRCADVSAVLAWLTRCESGELRRLHIAAQQHDKALFVMRPRSAATSASPARLRLEIETAGEHMAVRILKRRGPPLMQPLQLPAYSARLRALLDSRKASGRVLLQTTGERSHVLDRHSAYA